MFKNYRANRFGDTKEYEAAIELFNDMNLLKAQIEKLEKELERKETLYFGFIEKHPRINRSIGYTSYFGEKKVKRCPHCKNLVSCSCGYGIGT